jgi:hypothetical protein
MTAAFRCHAFFSFLFFSFLIRGEKKRGGMRWGAGHVLAAWWRAVALRSR